MLSRSFRIPETLDEEIRKMADYNFRSYSNQIIYLLKFAISNLQEEKGYSIREDKDRFASDPQSVE